MMRKSYNMYTEWSILPELDHFFLDDVFFWVEIIGFQNKK